MSASASGGSNAASGHATPAGQDASLYYDSTSPPGASSKPAPGQTKIRRRNRLINSCLECRRRKLKCDKQAPCSNCSRFQRDCLYLAPTLDPHSQQKLANIKERMGALEKNLEREVASTQAKGHLGGANVTKTAGDAGQIYVKVEEEESEDEGEETLEPTPLTSIDNMYEDNEDDELMDLGVQMGKMRISERVGGWIRPKLVEELTDTLDDVAAGKSNSPKKDQSQQRLQASPKSYIGPGPDYIAPASSFFFPGSNVSTAMMAYLPTKAVADQLIAQYFHAVHYLTRSVHQPTFEVQYVLFWESIASGIEPVPSLQAIIFAAFFSAAVSLDDDQAMQMFGTSKAILIDSLRSGTEVALSKANFLRTTKIDTMQAFVMYLTPLIRAEVSRAHSVLVGTAIRLAECMGLHRDGSLYNLSPVEVHVRRMLWHQLCFLDVRSAEATGPRPQIRKDDYDTKYPLNVNDDDLLSPNPPTEDSPYWTDMTLFRIRIEYHDLRRILWYEIPQIDKKKKTLTSALVKIQKFRASMLDRFGPMIDESIPIQVLGRHIMLMGISGCFIQALHRYLFSVTHKMPDRLRQILIESGVSVLENAVAIATKPELAAWAWYKGAMQQYHSALMLLIEVYAYPMRKEAPRIWKCLDYVFEIPPHLTPKQKAELVLTDLRDRMEVYHQMRKVKSTTQMEERVSSMRSPSSRDVSGSPAAQGASTIQQPLPPIPNFGQFSPPAPAVVESQSSESRQGSITGAGDVQMSAMEDIDWAEWDKYFPLEQNSGDLNIPDFDFAKFNGGYGGQPLNFEALKPAETTSSGFNIPSVEDLADVTFTPTYFHPADVANPLYPPPRT